MKRISTLSYLDTNAATNIVSVDTACGEAIRYTGTVVQVTGVDEEQVDVLFLRTTSGKAIT